MCALGLARLRGLLGLGMLGSLACDGDESDRELFVDRLRLT